MQIRIRTGKIIDRNKSLWGCAGIGKASTTGTYTGTTEKRNVDLFPITACHEVKKKKI